MAIRRQCPDCHEFYLHGSEHKCAPKSKTKVKPVEKIEAGLKEALAIVKGDAKPARVRAAKPTKAVEVSPVLKSSLEILMAERPSMPITATGRARAAKSGPKKVEPVAEVSAQPEQKSEPICQPSAKKRLTPAERTKRWREKNAEKHSAYMKGYAKDRRSKSSEARRREQYEALRAEFEGK
jgi:hypothetical protein